MRIFNCSDKTPCFTLKQTVESMTSITVVCRQTTDSGSAYLFVRPAALKTFLPVETPDLLTIEWVL
jgi:hypothetical protein